MVKLEKQINSSQFRKHMGDQPLVSESIVILQSREYKDTGFTSGDNFDLIYQVKPVKRVSDLFSDGMVNSGNMDRVMLRLIFSRATKYKSYEEAYEFALSLTASYLPVNGIELLIIHDEY